MKKLKPQLEVLCEHSQALGVIVGYVIFAGASSASISLVVFGLTIPLPDFSHLYNLGLIGPQIYALRTLWMFMFWLLMFSPLFATITISISWFIHFIPKKESKPLIRKRRIYGGIAGFCLGYCFILLAFGLVYLHFLILVNITNRLPHPYSLLAHHVILYGIVFVTLFLYFLAANTIQSATPKQFISNCFSNLFFWILLIILNSLFVAILFNCVYALLDIEETLYIQFSLLAPISFLLATIIAALPLIFIIFGNQAIAEPGKSNLKKIERRQMQNKFINRRV